MGEENRKTQRYLHCPPYQSIENGGFEIRCFKTAARLLVFCSGMEIPAAKTTVFLLSRWADGIFYIEFASY
jgi:hypothetical protein|nr:hypothetical protein [uncultured Oscillibacter sp.]